MWLAIAQSGRAVLLSVAAAAAAAAIMEKELSVRGCTIVRIQWGFRSCREGCAWRGSETLKILEGKGGEERRVKVLRGHRQAGRPFDGWSGGLEPENCETKCGPAWSMEGVLGGER
ncbi:hypothetical protein NA56DRAFT_646379 [Hyaloscypha hepaticicola]|uniref:Secreted protein n=1 Tax=Hyaloscypha hepaticicola TaxID=2082293 RepID=A0A2J6Q1S2_9HELO|nr:hypothetical protein NA56DRAFT_646379 [Hyaloscypha hepaticicola]